MGFWKTLGQVALGGAGLVTTVAAAPLLVGGAVSLTGVAAVSAAAASLAAAAGAVGTVGAAGLAGAAGVAAAKKVKDQAERKTTQAYEQGKKAGAVAAAAAHQAKLDAIQEKLREMLDYQKAVGAMFALGIAVANLDGEVSEEEREELEDFISGISKSHLPRGFVKQLEDYYDDPPSIDEALASIAEAGVDRAIVEDLITLVIEADGVVAKQETAFLRKWKKYKAA